MPLSKQGLILEINPLKKFSATVDLAINVRIYTSSSPRNMSRLHPGASVPGNEETDHSKKKVKSAIKLAYFPNICEILRKATVAGLKKTLILSVVGLKFKWAFATHSKIT